MGSSGLLECQTGEASRCSRLAFTDALESFDEHLRYARGRSPHTQRAYHGDVAALLAYAASQGATAVDDLDIRLLRGWLGAQAAGGAARSSLARRGASARAFTSWAARSGRVSADPGLLLGTPKAVRVLPEVLRADEARQLMDVAAVAADDGSATGAARPRRPRAALRQRAPGRRAGRPRRRRHRSRARDGPGARQGRQGAHRAARPTGPGRRRRLARRRAAAARHAAVRRRPCCWEPGADGWGHARCVPWCTGRCETSRARRTSVRTGCGTLPRPICSRAAQTSGPSRSCSVTLRSQRPRSTRMSPSRG